MEKSQNCCLCSGECHQGVLLPEVGQLCQRCLLEGRFLACENLPKQWGILDKITEFVPDLGRQIEQLTSNAQPFIERKDYQEARKVLLQSARSCRQKTQPLLAYLLLKKALALPGQSAEVYEEMGGALLDMKCTDKATLCLKTCSWLALKAEQDDILERALTLLDQLCPQDEWLSRARGRRQARGKESRLRCRLCGRDESQVGTLIQENTMAICGECQKRIDKFSD